jgi:hypothetical protein
MRGADDPEIVNKWLKILKQVYEFSCSKDAPTPVQLAESFSHLGPDMFLQQVFDYETITDLLKSWPAMCDLRTSLMNGIRLIQMLAYKLDEIWSEEVEEHVEGRSAADNLIAPGPFRRVVMNRERLREDAVELPNGIIFRLPDVVDGLIDEYSFGDGDGNTYTLIIRGGMRMFEDQEGRSIRWHTFGGRALERGSERDAQVNFTFYREQDELLDDFEIPDELPDFDDD